MVGGSLFSIEFGMSAMRLPPLSSRLGVPSVLVMVLAGVTAFFLFGVADASDSVTVSHDGFQLTCPGLIAEGSTLTCTLTNTAATEEDWPVVGILHRSADSNRALVRGSPLDVELNAPTPEATIEGGVWWIGRDLVGYSFFDWSGTAAAASGATTTTTGATTTTTSATTTTTSATTNSRQVVISILDDGDDESEEVFYVSLASDGSRNVGLLYNNKSRVRISDGDSKSSDSSLSGLRIFAGGEGEEQPLTFSSIVLSYQTTVDYDVTEVTLIPTVTHERATVTVNGVQAESGAESAAVHLASGTTSIAVLVTAEDGTSQTYTVAVSRGSRTENVEVAVGGFTLSCPSQVVEGSTLTCTLTNTGSDAAPWPVVAIIHSSADDNRAIITEDSVIDSTSSSYRVDLEFTESQTPERENYKYGYGELFSGGSMSVYTVYGYEKFDWSGEAAASASRTVSIDTKSDDEHENEDGEVFFVALAASDSTGLSGLVDNKAPIVLVEPSSSAPTIDSVTPGDRAVTVEWTAPTDATLETITSYDLRYIRSDASDKADARWTVVSSIWTSGSLEYTLNPTPRLVNGVSYDVQVRAVVGTDQHSWSSVHSATPRTTPGAPMVDTITGTDGSLAVEWQAPGSDGGDEITSYDLRYIKTSEDETIEANWTVEPGVWTSGDLEFDLTGLDDGTRYDVQVRAVNGAGAGAWSAAGVGTTRPGAPAIDSVTGVERGLTVGWSAPALDGDATVTSYDLRYIKTSEDETLETNWTVETGAWITGDLTATVTGLEVGTQYDVQVRAVNASGEGPWSASRMGTTALSDDATLSALALSGVRLTPAFSSGITSYTASVGYTVTRITVAATASDGNAGTEILDGNGNTRTDADGAAGFQVDLSAGENEIQVEVTAQDGVATETYGVTVTRTGPDLSLTPPANDPVAPFASTAVYTVRFQGRWATTVTPEGRPGGAHFSPLIGGVHGADVAFLRSGGPASGGVEQMAETGATGTLRNEVQAAINATPPTALSVLRRSGNIGATGPDTLSSVMLTTEFPRVTLTTMIAPSPDWFVGVSGLPLLNAAGRWLRTHEVDLFPWDAGTEDGTGFSLSNPATSPRGVITSIRGTGKFTTERIASLTFTLQSITTERGLVENTPDGVNIGPPVSPTVSGSSVSYILGGADEGSFDLVGSTGQLRTKPGVTYDHETKDSYTVIVTATDADGSIVTTVDIAVEDVDEAPEITGPTSIEFVEDGTGAVATYRASDPEGETVTWQLAGPDAGVFEISASGVLTFEAPPNYEDQEEYEVTVRASADGERGFQTGTLDVTVTVTDVDEAAEISFSVAGGVTANGNALAVVENHEGALAAFSASDPESKAGLVYTWFLGGTDRGDFAVTSAGVLSFVNVADYELPVDSGGNRVYDITVSARDSDNNTGTIAVTVTVHDVNEPPTIGGDPAVSVEEGATLLVGTYWAIDPESATVAWRSLAGADSDKFEFTASNGRLAFKAAPDYEDPTDAGGDNFYDVTLGVSAGGHTTAFDVAVGVTNKDEAGALGLSLPRPQADADYTATLSDPDGVVSTAWTWERSTSRGGPWAAVTGATGGATTSVYRPVAGDVGYFLRATAAYTDRHGPNKSLVVVSANPVRAAPPTNIAPSFDDRAPTRRVPEDAPAGAAVGAPVTATDSDSGDVVTYELSGSDLFTIERGSGQIRVVAGGSLDFESAPSHSVTVRASDTSDTSDVVTVTVTVTDVDEAAEISFSVAGGVTANGNALAVVENHEGALAAFSASDPESKAGLVYTWFLGGTDRGDFAVTSAGVLSFVNVADYELPVDSGGNRVYDITVSARDSDNNTGTIAVTVTVHDVNEPPTITGDVTLSFPEHVVRPVATYRATDPERDTITWSVSGPDGDDFEISDTGVLTFVDVPDFENPADVNQDNDYIIKVEARDDISNTAILDVTVTVTNSTGIEEPTITTTRDPSPYRENGTGTVYAFRARDPQGGLLTWIVTGTDSHAFEISPSGVLTFASPPDYENPTDSNRDNNYEIRVVVTDDQGFTDGAGVTVMVTNDAEGVEPTISTRRPPSKYRENDTATIYTFRAADPQGAPITWSLSGPDDDFAIIADSRGRGVLAFTGPPDFENPTDADGDNVYEVTVVATDDDGHIDSLAVTVTVTDVNEEPVVSGLESLSFAENQATDRVLAIYGAIDPEDPSALISRWSLSGRDGGDFTVSEGGELSFRRVPDFERPADSGRDNVYEFSVRASDGRNYGYLPVVVTVEDVNEALVITTTSRTSFSYRENGTATIYTFSAADPEGGAITWSTGGADGDDFAIIADSRGRGVLAFAGPPDFENPTDADRDNVYEVTVVAIDSEGNRAELQVEVTVTDVNEGPVVSGLQGLSFTENQATDRVLAVYSATDPEDPSALISRWSLSGRDGGDFTVSESGELSFRRVPDFERPADSGRDNVYEFSVRASDGRNYGYLPVVVTVEEVNEAPVITTTSRTSFSYRENGSATIYTFRAVDPERAEISWSLAGPDDNEFAIYKGILTFQTLRDFESPTDANGDNVYEVTVVAIDSEGNRAELQVEVTVTDVNEGPVVSGPEGLSFTENQATDRVLAIYGAIDPEDPSALISRWSLSGRDAGDFTISETGELSFRRVPDFERPADSGRDNVYEFSVRASDGRNYGYLPVVVTVEDVNEALVITTTSRTSFSYRENGSATIYTFSAADPERAEISWLTGGADGDDFAITRDSRGRGVLGFSSPPDFESPTDANGDNVYEVTVVAIDSEGNRAELQVEVTVTDVNEGPVVSGPEGLSFTENQATDRVLAIYGAIDPEDPSALISRWSLSGRDGGDFTVSEGGELSFRRVPDFERPADSGRDNVYEFSVRASDGRNYGYLPVVVTVEDVNEALVITTTSRTSFSYRENGTATIYTFSAADPERAEISWLTGGADGDDFAITRDSRGRGVLAFTGPPDFENPTDADGDNVYEVTVVATDDDGHIDSLAVTVTVTDVNEGPVVSGLQGLSFAENQATDRVLAIYGAIDPEDPSALISRWSLSGRDGGDFTVSEGGELSFRRVPDFERPADSGRDNVYEFSVRASDGRNYGYLPVVVTVEDVNEALVITTTSRTSFSYRENGTATIYTFSAADPERAEISWLTGGADGDDFAITRDSRGRGVLAFTGPPDFENPTDADGDNVYEVTVVATDDDGHIDSLAVTVTVTDVNEGPEISGRQSLSFTENQATDRVLATYTATDPEDPSAVISRWSLSGRDGGDFTVSEGGELSFRRVPDFERPADSGRDNVYEFSVRASDGRNYGYLPVVVTVEDVNEALVITTTSRTSFSYRENGSATIYTFSAADPERAEISWLTGGADGDDFAITRDSRGRGVLGFSSPPDFENPTDADGDNVYEVTVVATDDDGHIDSLAVTVTVTDVNEGPVVSGLQGLSFAENQATDRVLAIYGAIDPEDPSALISRWSLSGRDGGDFTVSEGGELSFRRVPDFERPADSGRDNVYEFSVRASDGRNYGYLPVVVTVEDVNEALVITTTSRTEFSYRENGTATIYTFSAADPERGAITWSTGGADGDDFAIIADSRGRGVLAFAGPPDFENPTDADRDNVYEVTVVAIDSEGNRAELQVEVTVTDVNEGPVVSGPEGLSFTENQATDRVLAVYSATDPEDPSALISRWSLSGRDGGDFTVSEGGELSFRRVPDFERPADSGRDNVYEFSVRASDGRNYGYLPVVVTVEDVNEALVITTTSRTEFSYRENGSATIYTFSAADPERAEISWLTGGADGDDFAITRDSRGRGVLAFTGPPDFENPTDADGDNVYEVTVVATDDDGHIDSLAVTVTVTDVNEGPEISGRQSLSFTENQPTDRVLATYTATDPEDPSAVISRWSLSGRDGGDFTVSEGGELSFRRVPDFERPSDSGRDNVYEFSVRASDGRNYGYLPVVVTVEDVNEALVITTTSRTSFSYRENGTATIYTFSAADPERAEISWLTGGADGDDFAITRDSRGRGVLGFSSPPDFENPTDADGDNVYEVTVVATDDDGHIDSLAVTVTVTDVNEGPEISGRQSLSFTENQPTDRVLATYTATDPEDPSALISRWSLSGRDGGDFTVSEGGELSFRRVPDFERPADSGRDNVYEFSVRASDGSNYGYLPVVVTVEDVNEALVITTTSRTEFSYRENGTATIYTFSAADPEGGAITWSTGGADGDDFAIIADSRGRGVLAFTGPPDFENPTDADTDNIYEVSVVATDDQGHADSLAVTVTVTPQSEGPEISGRQSLSFAENLEEGRVLATYTATDPEDPSALITRWSLSGRDAGDFAISESGELSFRRVPDFERPADSGRDNVYEFSVRASDGSNYGYLPVVVTVEDVNEAPVITGSDRIAYEENGTDSLATYRATDPERGTISWKLSGADSGVFTISDAGVLDFNKPPDYEQPSDSDGNNVYEVTVEAADAEPNTAFLEVTVTVTNQTD